MLTIISATIHYNNEIKLSTVQSSSYSNYIYIVVLAEYYQPHMIYLLANGVNKSLQSQTWTAIRYKNTADAYGVRISVPKGSVRIIYTKATAAAPMAAVVYGSNSAPSYGHPGGLNIPKLLPGA